jgi:tetratricopeptide (TPR) repeat protein
MPTCPTVCWNAIVRDEAHAIGRCLGSLVGQIDYWVVVDTGSEDDTPEIIASFFGRHGVPGELHRQAWVSFAHNRNQALRLAEHKADYLLLMDADMQLEVLQPDWRQKLRADAYLVHQRLPTIEQYLPRLVSARTEGDKRWRYRCATHEFIASEVMGATQAEPFQGIAIRDFDDGGCKVDKFVRDAALLEAQLRELEALDGLDASSVDAATAALLRDRPVLLPRTLFYLGESYRNGGIDLAKAVHYYRRRTEAGGWAEEIAFAWLQIGRCLELLGAPWPEAQDAYLAAYQASPRRGEALLALSRHYSRAGSHALAHLFAARAMALGEPPAEGLFVDRADHRWGIPDEYALTCYWTGRHTEAAEVWRGLLAGSDLPDTERARVQTNLVFALKALGSPPRDD